MPFTVRAALSPTDAANNWSTGVQAAGTKLATKYASPRRDPQAAAVAAAPEWLAKTTAALPLYTANVGNYSADAAIASMKTNGVPRYQAAATTKKANYLKVAGPLLQAISGVVAGLPADRSSAGARDQRMLANAAGLRALRGKFRKNTVA